MVSRERGIPQLWPFGPFSAGDAAPRKNQPADAIRLLEVTLPYELGCPPDGVSGLPALVRGQAYLFQRDGAKAAAEHRKLLDSHDIDPINANIPLARLGLAPAYAMQGDAAKSPTVLKPSPRSGTSVH